MHHYILDTKCAGDFDDFPTSSHVYSDTCPAPIGNKMYQVWHVVQVIPEEIEKWLFQILRSGEMGIVEIDELNELTYSANQHSPMFNRIQKQGRGLGIGTITLSQELSKIPSNAYKQATHRLGFYLEGTYDILVRSNMLKSKVANPPDWYGFYYQHINGRGEPLYFSSIYELLKK